MAARKSDSEQKAPVAPASKKDKEWQKAYGTLTKGDKQVYGGGGHVGFQDGDNFVRMIPGQVRTVPSGVIKRFNERVGGSAVFVEPGSQVEGAEVKKRKKA